LNRYAGGERAVGLIADEEGNLRGERRAFLLSVLPPSSVSRDLESIQGDIFRSTGNYSAIALPPLIPLRFLPNPPTGVYLRDAAARLAGVFSLGPRILLADSVFFRLNEAERLEGFDPCGERGNPYEGFIPAFPGVFLGQSEPGRPASEILARPVDERPWSWRAAQIAVFEIAYDPERWWSALCWEVVDSAFCPRGAKGGSRRRGLAGLASL
jgi:hypothetical protein